LGYVPSLLTSNLLTSKLIEPYFPDIKARDLISLVF